MDQLQADVDQWVRSYNKERPHSGKHCFGKTPWQTFLDSKALALEKQLDRTMPTTTAAALAAFRQIKSWLRHFIFLTTQNLKFAEISNANYFASQDPVVGQSMQRQSSIF